MTSSLLTNSLCHDFQSVDGAHHSTDTALLDVKNCFLGSADDGQVSVLTVLDLLAAFDTLDPSILLAQLHDVFGMSDKALEWFSSYLSNRGQAVSSSQKKLHHRFLGVHSWVQFFLLWTLNHCLKSFLNVSEVITNLLLHQSSTPADFHSLIVEVEQCVG